MKYLKTYEGVRAMMTPFMLEFIFEDEHILGVIERCFDIMLKLQQKVKDAYSAVHFSEYNKMTYLVREELKRQIRYFLNSNMDKLNTFDWDKLPNPDYDNIDRWGVKALEDYIEEFTMLIDNSKVTY